MNARTALYTPNQILLASCLGAPIGGAILFAANEQRLGRPKGVVAAFAFGIVMTVGVFGLAFGLPDRFAGLSLLLLGMGAMRGAVQVVQAGHVTQHIAWGGRKASSWAAAGVGIVCAVGLVTAVYAVGFGGDVVANAYQ